MNGIHLMAGAAQVRNVLLRAEGDADPMPATLLKAMRVLVAGGENQKRQQVVPFDPFLYPDVHVPPLAQACRKS